MSFFPPPSASSLIAYTNSTTEAPYSNIQSNYVAASQQQQQQQQYQPPQLVIINNHDPTSPPLVRRMCCSCLPKGFALTPLALFFSLIAFCLNTVAFSNNGDIFWGGWSAAPDPKSRNDFGSQSVYYRITLSHQNTCSVSDFCDDFFADSSQPIASLAGGSQLANIVYPIQSTFGAAAILALLTVIGFIYCASSCCCHTSSSSATNQYDVTSSSSRRWRRIALMNALIHSFTACAIFYILKQYSNATAPFIAAQNIISFTFQSGYSCASVGGWFHVLGAIIWLQSGLRSALLAKKSTATPIYHSPTHTTTTSSGSSTYYLPAQAVIFNAQQSHSEPLIASSSPSKI